MPKLPTIATLWIGDTLSWLEQLCLRSFVDAGHDVRLYAYGAVRNVPDGVSVFDANEIFSGENIFRHSRTGSPAIHADLWRLHLLKKTDCIWVDADVLCVKPFDFESQFVFGREKAKLVCNAVMRLPSHSRTLACLLDFVADPYAIGPWLSAEKQDVLRSAKNAGTPVHFSEQDWGLTGPAAFTHYLIQTGEWEHALPEAAFYPVSFRDRNKMITPKYDVEAEFLNSSTYAVHLWARRMKPRLEEAEGNRPKRDSFLYRALIRHGINPDLAPIPAKTIIAAPASPRTSPKQAALAMPKAVSVQSEDGSKIAPRGESGDDDTVITCNGIKVPLDRRIITPKIEKPLRSGRYEGGEIASLRRVLRQGDRVLELGAGLGLCSTAAAQFEGVEAVVAVEANPELIPLIRETHRLNGVEDRIDVRNCVITAEGGTLVPFYLRADFWAASLEADSRPYVRVEHLVGTALADLIAEIRPTVLVCDIEGGELGLFDGLDLSCLRHVVIELHPKVYGNRGLAQIAAVLSGQGLFPAADNVPGSTVQRFDRQAGLTQAMPGSKLPARPYKPWLPKEPRILIGTCMKDEGPFILEWLAWHKTLGVTDFVVFTNDCSDGTDRILQHLSARGEVLHLPNPASVMRSRAFQPVALAYLHMLPVFQQADFVLSIDVDEFVNIRCGAGRFGDLFAATGPFDAISISELNHGSNKRVAFENGWIRSQFLGHQTESPGKRAARRGVKTLTRLSPIVAAIRNHRPDFLSTLPPMWLDGSGRYTDWFSQNASENGMDVRGSYDLVSLEHYALRSLESFFMKTLRGDVVVANKSVSRRYWRVRNQNEVTTSTYKPELDAAAWAYYVRHYQSDPELMALHDHACDWHRAKIAEISTLPEFVARRAWIMENAWENAPPDEE